MMIHCNVFKCKSCKMLSVVQSGLLDQNYYYVKTYIGVIISVLTQKMLFRVNLNLKRKPLQ